MPGAETAERQLSQNELGKRAQNLMAAVGDYCANSVLSEPPEGVSYSEHDFNSIIARIKRLQGQYGTQREGGLSVQQAGAIMRNEIRQADALQKLRVVGENSEEESRLQNQLRGLQEGHRQLLANFGFRELPEPAHPGPAANSGGHVHPGSSVRPLDILGAEQPTTRLSEPGDRTKRLLKALHRLQEDPGYVAPGEGDGFNPVELGRVRAMLADYPTEQGAKIIEAEICLEDIEERLASVEGPNGNPEAAERLNREKTYWEAEKQRRLTLPSQRIDENDQDMQSTGAIPANEPTHRLTGAEMDRLIEENYHVLGERGKIQLAALHRLQEQPQLLGPSEDDEFTATQLKAVRNRLSAAAANYSELSADQQVAVVEADIYLDDINIKLQDTHLNAEDREILERHRAHWLAEKQRRVDTQHAETQEGDAVWNQPTTRFNGSDQHTDAAGSSIPDTPTEHLSPDQLPGGHNAITVRDLSAADHVSEEQQAEPGFDPEVFEMLSPREQERIIVQTIKFMKDPYTEALLIASLPDHYREDLLTGIYPISANVREHLATMWGFNEGYDDPHLSKDKCIALGDAVRNLRSAEADMMIHVLTQDYVYALVEDTARSLRGRLLVSQYALKRAPDDRFQQLVFEQLLYDCEQLYRAAQTLSPYMEREIPVLDNETIATQGERWITESIRIKEEGLHTNQPEGVTKMLDAVSQAAADGLYPDLDLAIADLHTILQSRTLSKETRIYLFEFFSPEELTKELSALGITPEILQSYYSLTEGKEDTIESISDLNTLFTSQVENLLPHELALDLCDFMVSELLGFQGERSDLIAVLIDKLIEYQKEDSNSLLGPISPTQRVQLEALIYGYFNTFDQTGFYDANRIANAFNTIVDRRDDPENVRKAHLQTLMREITYRNEGDILDDGEWESLIRAIDVFNNATRAGIPGSIFHRAEDDIEDYLVNRFGADTNLGQFVERSGYLISAYNDSSLKLAEGFLL